MSNVFNMVFCTNNAERGCEVMDWLNDNGIQYGLSLEGGAFKFTIQASRLQVTTVNQYFGY